MAVTTEIALVCPKCGSGRVHPVRNPNVLDSLCDRIGLQSYRCETCSRRFRDWLEWLGEADD